MRHSRYKKRQRIDWDEEIHKTERIRRKGLFVSALGLGIAAVFVFGAGRAGPIGVDVGRKLIFTFCFVTAMFLLRGIFRRRERLRQKREEREEELLLAQTEQNKNSGYGSKKA